MHKGARVEGGEYFDDIFRHDKEAGGILDGLGRSEFENLKESIGQDGVHETIACRVCGKDNEAIIDYEELFVVGTNQPGVMPLLPTGWDYSENNAKCYPANLACRKCGTPGTVCPQFTPQEARDHVNEAVSMGWVPVGQVQMWKQRAAAARAQMGG